MDKNCVIASIRPVWCGMIAELIKDLEIRKTIPKLPTPFKVYIYCTRSFALDYWVGEKGAYVDYKARSVYDTCGTGRVIGEFVCDRTIRYTTRSDSTIKSEIETQELLHRSGLTFRELIDYEAGAGVCKRLDLNRRKGLWAWHISQLKIYDKPMFLEDFGLTKPPQSWCYVKEVA